MTTAITKKLINISYEAIWVVPLSDFINDLKSFRFEAMLITAMVFGIIGLLLSLLSLALIWICHERDSQSTPLEELQMQDLKTQTQAQHLLAPNEQG